MSRKIYMILSLLLMVAFVLSACGSPATPAPVDQPAATEAPAQEPTATEAPAQTQAPAEKVTVTWWHISTKDPGLSDWQKMADDYMAAHPNVNIEITVLENEAFKTKLTTVMQSGEVPDIFQSWGGGTFNQQVEAGLLKDITADLNADPAWRDSFAPGALGVYSYQGKNYGVPWDMGIVGFWYNKALFKQAGIDAPPTTWTEFLDDVKSLKDAGITPISIGEGDKWPGMHFWNYLATRICGKEKFEAAMARSGSFADPCFVEAGTKLKELVALEPFQEGFLGAVHDDMQAAFGNGKAAMELSGQWAPSTQAANSADQKGIGENLGLFGFPAVEDGAGAGTDVVGGGNGFAIGKDAEPEAIDFVKYLTSVENQTIIAAHGTGIPVVKGAEKGLTDPNMLQVQSTFAAADYFQLYYDQFLPPATGSVLNDSVQGLFAGTMTPEEVAQAVEDSVAQEVK
ncbi:MAG TPA: extracellular solute-binding protein [Anaerolineales bacterium]|nr:extracellular solute-binding protein [Anaerolineales bacterium]